MPRWDARAATPNVEGQLLGRGTLGTAEECAADLAPLVDDFLARADSDSTPA